MVKNTYGSGRLAGIPMGAKVDQAASDMLKNRNGEKRLTLAVDGVTYKRLRHHAADIDETHQAILERALVEYLNRICA